MDAVKKASRTAAGVKVEDAAGAAKPWIERLARLGYAAKGIVYAVVGLLALQAARGAGSANVDKNSAMSNILRQPYGQLLMVLLGMGLLGYAIWRLVQALADPEREGKGTKAILERAGYFVTGVSYAALAFGTWRMAMGLASSAEKEYRDVTVMLMQWPYGRWLVALLGLVILAVGLAQFYQAFTGKFERRLKYGELSQTQRTWIMRMGTTGYAAKGVVYVLVGYFLLQAGLRYDPGQAGGLGEALQTLAGQQFGAVVLAAVAAGLIAYGAYAIFLAQYRRIHLR